MVSVWFLYFNLRKLKDVERKSRRKKLEIMKEEIFCVISCPKLKEEKEGKILLKRREKRRKRKEE